MTEEELNKLIDEVESQIGWARFNYTKGNLGAGLTCLINACDILREAGATDNKEGYRG